MRKPILLILLIATLGLAGFLLLDRQTQQLDRLTIEASGEPVVLISGENVDPDTFALAKSNPEFLSNIEWVFIDGEWQALAAGVNIPVEAQQLILPEDHPEFPLNTTWVVVQGDTGPIEAPIPLTLPSAWAETVEILIDGPRASFRYALLPDRKHAIFSITAMTESQWEAIQAEPHGEAIFTYQGIVYVYQPALENPYEDLPETAKTFSSMVGEASQVVNSLPRYFMPGSPLEAARTTLVTYFNALNTGRYSEAARVFGGDWDAVRDMNPEIDPESYLALLESACKVNGFLCSLQVDQILEATEFSGNEFRFRITFKQPDGTPFELGPCCGEDPDASTPTSIFDYTVRAQGARYLVIELPIYTP